MTKKYFPYHNNTDFSLNEVLFKPIYINTFKDEDHLIYIDVSIIHHTKEQKGENAKTKYSHQFNPIIPN